MLMVQGHSSAELQRRERSYIRCRLEEDFIGAEETVGGSKEEKRK
jgi:hypothetical protein